MKAEAAGVIPAMEPLNRFETGCINTLDQAVDMIESVGSPGQLAVDGLRFLKENWKQVRAAKGQLV